MPDITPGQVFGGFDTAGTAIPEQFRNQNTVPTFQWMNLPPMGDAAPLPIMRHQARRITGARRPSTPIAKIKRIYEIRVEKKDNHIYVRCFENDIIIEEWVAETEHEAMDYIARMQETYCARGLPPSRIDLRLTNYGRTRGHLTREERAFMRRAIHDEVNEDQFALDIDDREIARIESIEAEEQTRKEGKIIYEDNFVDVEGIPPF